jgi:hypothetical protein
MAWAANFPADKPLIGLVVCTLRFRFYAPRIQRTSRPSWVGFYTLKRDCVRPQNTQDRCARR